MSEPTRSAISRGSYPPLRPAVRDLGYLCVPLVADTSRPLVHCCMEALFPIWGLQKSIIVVIADPEGCCESRCLHVDHDICCQSLWQLRHTVNNSPGT